MLGEVRGTVGYAFDRFLIYASRWLRLVALSTSARLPAPLAPRTTLGACGPAGPLEQVRSSALAPDWTARIEYVHDQFAPVNATLPSGTSGSATLGVHNLILGLNRRLQWPGDNSSSSASEPSVWSIHGQFTLVGQGYLSFRSPYEGANSLSGASQARDTMSATVFLGVRLWRARRSISTPS